MANFLHEYNWVFVSTKKNDDSLSKIGGALCISSNGLILTVAHNLQINNANPMENDFCARSSGATNFYNLNFISWSTNFDLALLQVVDGEGNAINDERFEFYDLNNSAVEVKIYDDVVAWVHQDNFLFTKKEGYTCYPFPKNVSASYPDINDTTELQSVEKPDEDTLTDQAYKTVDCVVDEADKELIDLHPKLPLIQVTGFGDEQGSSGCPFFKTDGTFLGLCCFSKQDFQYIIPVDLIEIFVLSFQPNN